MTKHIQLSAIAHALAGADSRQSMVMTMHGAIDYAHEQGLIDTPCFKRVKAMLLEEHLYEAAFAVADFLRQRRAEVGERAWTFNITVFEVLNTRDPELFGPIVLATITSPDNHPPGTRKHLHVPTAVLSAALAGLARLG